MGVKLFAWIGGLALFLGLAFFVKYSFDNNLISPEIRVAIGYVIGVALLVGGLVLAGRKYSVLGQTLCSCCTRTSLPRTPSTISLGSSRRSP